MPRLKPGLGHLLVVYLSWGSTFLAIRIAVQGDGAFHPFTLAMLRVGTAGLIMLALATLQGHGLRLGGRVLARLALSGLFFWVGGHALLLWAAQKADSGFAALIFASIPLWTAVIESLKRRRALSRQVLLPILTGFAGVLILTVPEMQSGGGSAGGAVYAIVLLISAFSWAFASSLHGPETQDIPVAVSAGYQQLFAGLACGIIALIAGESWPAPGPRALAAWFYLVSVGSVLAFSSYVRAQQLLPNNIVASFAYVNPIIAVGLGAWFLDERISAWVAAGMVLVIISVIWLLQSGLSARKGEA